MKSGRRHKDTTSFNSSSSSLSSGLRSDIGLQTVLCMFGIKFYYCRFYQKVLIFNLLCIFPALLLTTKPKPATPTNPPTMNQLHHSVCYVTPSSALNLPHLDNITKFLDLVDKEAAMFVTKLSRSLYFDIGQPINVDVDKYGLIIHQFCSGNTAFALKPMDVMDFLRQNMKQLVPQVEGGEMSQEIEEKFAGAVEKQSASNPG